MYLGMCDRVVTRQNGDNTGYHCFARPDTMTSASAPRSDTTAQRALELTQLDALTAGAFTAATSGERTARVRAWLAAEPGPSAEDLQLVFKELSVKDKGAAKPVRERLDELRRAKGQEALAVDWANKAQALLSQPKINIADALAWQRDAAKAGAPLSREPLLGVKLELAERVKVIEDLQHRTQVQREAAVLLAQRIEVLSTKSWVDAQVAAELLAADVLAWQAQAHAIASDANWISVDVKFPPLLEASKAQLGVVWQAFQEALAQTVAAAGDAAVALPSVPMWANELRVARGVALEAAAEAHKPRVDPELLRQLRAQATQAVHDTLAKVEQEVAQGHGKASAGAAAALRNALKAHARHIDDKLEAKAHAALAAAGELEGWQRWRADQLREELVAKAEGLLKRPDGQAIGGRKMQENLRALREQWKQTDQGGVPNHALWKRFDEACNEAHKVVEAWLDKLKAEASEHRAQRLALIDELKSWAQTHSGADTVSAGDWKAVSRGLHQFADRWREAGHLSEKAFAELQPLWKEAFAQAAAPLEAVQQSSLTRRHAMIEEAQVLGAAAVLHIDSVKQLQQRWQVEAHAVPLDRRHEQKLWDAFRKPIDEAFNRKTQEREKAATAMGAHDRAVLDAAKILEQANAAGDAAAIRAAMVALDAATRGQTQAALEAQGVQAAPSASPSGDSSVAGAGASVAAAESVDTAPVPLVVKTAKPVLAMRGDDRPGMKKSEPAASPARGGKPGERRDGRDSRMGGGARDAVRGGAAPGRGDRERFSSPQDQRGPRLGDAAFRAQREALERAEMALRKLAAQAHGEALTQVLAAWEKRDPSLLPSAQELGARVGAGARAAWVQALGGASRADDAGVLGQTLLRLEMAAELPSPAQHLDARRALQLQLLTRRNDPTPVQTWGQDVGRVLASAVDAESARRLQAVLKQLLKR